MLIEWQAIQVLREGAEVFAKPMWKALGDHGHRFRRRASVGLDLGEGRSDAARPGAAAAGLARDGHGKAFVECGGEQRGLSVARVANGRDSPGVDFRQLFQGIQHLRKTPRPGSDRRGSSGIARSVSRRSVFRWVEFSQRWFGKRRFIGDEIALVERSDGIPALDRGGGVPDVGFFAAIRFARAVSTCSVSTRPHPAFRQRNARKIKNRVVSVKVQAEETRRRPLLPVRRHDEQMHRCIQPYIDGELAHGRRAVQCLLLFEQQRVALPARPTWPAPVHVLLEQRAELWLAQLFPLVAAHHAWPLTCDQRIGRIELLW